SGCAICRCRRRGCGRRWTKRSRCAPQRSRTSHPSFPRTRESRGDALHRPPWAPASAGATKNGSKVRMTYMPKELQKVVGTRPIRRAGVERDGGKAIFGADRVRRGMLGGKAKRTPHAPARIMSINTERARPWPGVRGVVTGEDFPPIPSEEAFVGEGP